MAETPAHTKWEGCGGAHWDVCLVVRDVGRRLFDQLTVEFVLQRGVGDTQVEDRLREADVKLEVRRLDRDAHELLARLERGGDGETGQGQMKLGGDGETGWAGWNGAGMVKRGGEDETDREGWNGAVRMKLGRGDETGRKDETGRLGWNWAGADATGGEDETGRG